MYSHNSQEVSWEAEMVICTQSSTGSRNKVSILKIKLLLLNLKSIIFLGLTIKEKVLKVKGKINPPNTRGKLEGTRKLNNTRVWRQSILIKACVP